MTYFVGWLWRRATKKVFENKWEWIEDYQRLIIRDKWLSLIVTLGFGFAWFFSATVATLLVMGTEGINNNTRLFGTLLKFYLLAVPVFYVVNWLVALYNIYDTERIATWERLKD